MFKKKQVVPTPESRIQGADIHVEAQKDQFRKMKEEVLYARKERHLAINELSKEVESLKAQLAQKQKAIRHANDQNRADQAYVEQIDKFIGE